MNIKTLIEKSKLTIPKERILFNEPMKKHSTFKIGGQAECFIKVQNIQELKEILKFANNNNIKITVIGNGSNLLVLDSGIKGITIMMNLEKYEIIEEKPRKENEDKENEDKENIEKTAKNKEQEGKEKGSKIKVQVIAESRV